MTDLLETDESLPPKPWSRRLLRYVETGGCRYWPWRSVSPDWWLESPDLPEEAPGFVLQDLEGNSVALDDFQGRPVVLNFWATWCGPCQIEIPSFSQFADDNPDVVVLGVAMDGSPEELTRAAQEMGIRYPVVLANPEIKEAYGVTTLPTTVIIDPAGEVHSAHTGMMLVPNRSGKPVIGKWC